MDTKLEDKAINGLNGHDADASQQTKSHHLEAIMVKRSRFSYADKTLYRVYDSEEHFELVEAESAHEAFEKSTVKNAIKIQRELFYHYVAIDPELMEPTDEVIEVDVQLPNDEEKRILLDAAMLDEAEARSAKVFEELALAEIWDKSRGHDTAVETDLLEATPPPVEEEPASILPQPNKEDVSAAQPEPEPEPEPEEEVELSADDVNALLNAQEADV